MKRVISLILVLVLAFTMVACGTKAPEPTEGGDTAPTGGTIKIAFVGPQTGDNAEYGKMMKAGVQVAIDEWNEKGGIIGKTIVMEDFDDKNDAQEAGTIAEKIVSDDSFVAVIGHFSSGVAMTAAEIYQEAGIPLINGSAAHVDYSAIGDCIFRNNAIYTVDAASALQIINHFEYKKFASLQPNSDAGVSITACVEDYMAKYGDKLGAKLVATELFEDGTVDFSAIINKMNEAGAEVVYTTAAYSIVAPFIKQYAAINPDVKFVLSSGCFSQEFLELAGDAANGCYVPNSFFYKSDREATKNFTAAFNAFYGSDPSTFAAQCYDAANMIFLAIEAGKSDARADIVKNLYEVTFDGAAGKTEFNENGDCPKQQVCLKIVDGDWTEVPDVILSPVDWAASLA
ncbi:MAG: ABC transporter substrate-binding protein [Oscillospiraceae bacterium]